MMSKLFKSQIAVFHQMDTLLMMSQIKVVCYFVS